MEKVFNCKLCTSIVAEKGAITLKEMMYGTKDTFSYFQCADCGCIQIAAVPANLEKYYPVNYYSYTDDNMPPKRKNFFQIAQCKYIVSGYGSLLGKLITHKYKPPFFYYLLKELQLKDASMPVLDVGSGTGSLLKDFYTVGYKDLTGIDPFINSDIIYNQNLRVFKKTVFDEQRQYQAIMLHHSLEHMDEQEAVLNKLYSLLKPKGILLLRIPVVSKPLMEIYNENVVSLDPPRHLYIHSAKSIEMLAKKAGFTIVKKVYDANEFSFWASEQYKMGISLNNNPESHLVKKLFSDAQLAQWRSQISKLNSQEQSDNLAIYLTKK